MRVGDVGYALVDSWGDLRTEINPDPLTDEAVASVCQRAGAPLKQVALRLVPDQFPGETLAQALMQFIQHGDFVEVSEDSIREVVDHVRTHGWSDLPDFEWRWSANSDEQIGKAVKNVIALMRLVRSDD